MEQRIDLVDTRVSNEIQSVSDIDYDRVSRVSRDINLFREIVRKELREGYDFGVIPGCGDKLCLLKPGAERIAMIMGLKVHYDFETKIENYEKSFFAYTVKSKLLRGSDILCEGFGSCNSKEEKYAYKWVSEKQIPKDADREHINVRTTKFGVKYRIDNEDTCSIGNTILKMAKKRAMVDAVLTVAALSEIFTQDFDDLTDSGQSFEITVGNKQEPIATIPVIEAEKPKIVIVSKENVIKKSKITKFRKMFEGHGGVVIHVLKSCGIPTVEKIPEDKYDEVCDMIKKQLEVNEREVQ